MQDYSPFQYHRIRKLYPCRKTILGDAGQSGNPYGSSTAGISGLIAAYHKSQFRSLGIICKTESQAYELAEHLKAHTPDVHFLSSRSSAFIRGIITSAHMAKGLEFDEVIVPQSDTGIPAKFIRPQTPRRDS